jgi:hypothetical protein
LFVASHRFALVSGVCRNKGGTTGSEFRTIVSIASSGNESTVGLHADGR